MARRVGRSKAALARSAKGKGARASAAAGKTLDEKLAFLSRASKSLGVSLSLVKKVTKGTRTAAEAKKKLASLF